MIFGISSSLAWVGRSALAVMALFCAASGVFAQAGGLVMSSQFSASEVVVGRPFKYTVSIRKAEDFAGLLETPQGLELPATPSLTFGRFQRNEQYQSASGLEPVGISLEFDVTAKVEGRVVMPGFSIRYMGKDWLVPPSVVRVRSPVFETSQEEVEWMSFRFVELPAQMRVGERFKANLEMHVFQGLRNVTFTQPVATGTDFAVDRLSPGPTERLINKGAFRYRVYTWPVTFTPLRSGEVAVGFRTSINFRIPTDRIEFLRAARANNAVGAAQMEVLLQDSNEETVALFTPPSKLRVEPLPDATGVTGFYHAIGQFSVAVKVENDRLDVGQPLNLSLVVEGEGNFGAFKAPSLMLDNRWRVFPPQEVFEDLDFLSYKGRLTYRFVVIPLSAEITRLPSIAYTYFDALKGSYETIRSEPVTLHLAGESLFAGEDLLKSSAPDPANTPAETPDRLLSGSLLWSMGREASLGPPFVRNQWFWLANGLLLAVFSTLLVWRLQRLRFERDPRLRRRLFMERQQRRLLRMASHAAREHDDALFHEAAFLAFASLVAWREGLVLEAVTVELVQERFATLDLSPDLKRLLMSYLQRYEKRRFGGLVEEGPPLAHEFDRLKSLLSKVDVCMGKRKESAA
jgi:hypothetical protein